MQTASQAYAPTFEIEIHHVGSNNLETNTKTHKADSSAQDSSYGSPNQAAGFIKWPQEKQRYLEAHNHKTKTTGEEVGGR